MNARRTVLLAALALSGASVSAECLESELALADVPPGVMAAASAAVDAIVISEAERIGEGADAVYELEGEAGGVAYEIHVSPAGEILGVERDDD